MAIYNIYSNIAEYDIDDIREGCTVFEVDTDPRLVATFDDKDAATKYFADHHADDTRVSRVSGNRYQVSESYLLEEHGDDVCVLCVSSVSRERFARDYGIKGVRPEDRVRAIAHYEDDIAQQEEYERLWELCHDVTIGKTSLEAAEEQGLPVQKIPDEILRDPSSADVIDGDIARTCLIFEGSEWIVFSRDDCGGCYAYCAADLMDFDDDGHQTIDTAIAAYLRKINQ